MSKLLFEKGSFFPWIIKPVKGMGLGLVDVFGSDSNLSGCGRLLVSYIAYALCVLGNTDRMDRTTVEQRTHTLSVPTNSIFISSETAMTSEL